MLKIIETKLIKKLKVKKLKIKGIIEVNLKGFIHWAAPPNNKKYIVFIFKVPLVKGDENINFKDENFKIGWKKGGFGH